MAVFDVSFANKNINAGGSGTKYGVLIDRLSIMENNLSADGKLSPGDYKLLTEEAQKIYGNPGLTNDQRSNIEVKISQYQSASSKTSISSAQDITQLNNAAKDDQRKASMLLGNSPDKFLEAQAAIQHAKVSQLADAINSLDQAGADSSGHLNEYNDALASYQDTLQALDYVQKNGSSNIPGSDFVSYITTNNQGEITDVKIGREGSQSGYLETNGLYGGLKIYGKLNHKDNGKNVFLLGNQKYSAADTVIPGPDGSIKASTLINESMQKGKKGTYTTAVSGYSQMDPATTKTQQAIRPGGYAEGSKGFIYKNNGDGTYTKYVNTDPTKLGITQNDIINIPNSMESSLSSNVTSTIDGATSALDIPVNPNISPSINTNTSAPVPVPTPTGPQPGQAQPGPTPQPSARSAAQPASSSPSTQGNVFSKTVKSAQGFLGRIFGGS